jgi:hypothetical protein
MTSNIFLTALILSIELRVRHRTANRQMRRNFSLRTFIQ